LKNLRESGKKKAPVTRVTKDADTFIDTTTAHIATDSSAGRALNVDGEFFTGDQTSQPRLLVQGSQSHGREFMRMQKYPHQKAIGNDGKAIVGGVELGGDSSKKHFKRNKKRM
jgi:large subunit GTPase 1